MQPLFCYATHNAAQLWWDKPARAAAQQRYEVLLDGTLAGEAGRTHLCLAGLAPGSAHTAAVRLAGEAEPFAACAFSAGLPKARLDVTAAPYGASGDGQAMDTAALQRALDDCGPGQYVYLPAGIYRTGALRLHSNTELYLAEGAVLQGSAEPADYLPRIRSRFEGTELECYQSLLNLGSLDHAAGPNCENVLIHGRGTIRGGGYALAWATIESEREKLRAYLAAHADYVATCENADTIPGRVRGRLINLSNCRNVRISGLTLADGASWNVHMVYSQNILTDHCTFRSTGIWNGDGWDPDSSEDCTIFGCMFYTGDDSVAIKSGKNPEGNAIARPTRNIRVFDCQCAFGHGLCIGSEMSGGVEQVQIWDCDLARSMVGVEVKATKKRGGYVRGLSVRDCTVPCLLAHAVAYNDDGVGAPTPPVLEHFRYERVRITGRSLDRVWTDCPAIELAGFDEPGYELRDVAFRDVEITGGLGIRLHRCADVRFEAVQ